MATRGGKTPTNHLLNLANATIQQRRIAKILGKVVGPRMAQKYALKTALTRGHVIVNDNTTGRT